MLPTLYIGDYLFVAKWPYGYSRYSFPFGFPSFDGRILGSLPERGDVVVFRHPAENATSIKRVIGLPGDTVEVRGRHADPQRQAARRAQTLPPFAMPISANSPCKVVPPARPRWSPASATAHDLPLPRLSRDAARRAELYGARPGR